jgi:hypothetical protein
MTTPNQPVELTPEQQAQLQLGQAVYIPRFVEKCAAAGITFPDETTLAEALQSVEILRSHTAKDSGHITKQAAADLRKMAGMPALSQVQAQQDSVEHAKKLAASPAIQQLTAKLAATAQQPAA